MKLSKYLLCLSFIVLVTHCVVASVRLDIHIESLCRFSSKFITTQFGPSYDAIKDNAVISFHIYGKSNTIENNDGNVSFKCQHGNWECEKNIYMTCVLHYLGFNTDLKAQFVVCAMNFTNEYPACVRDVNLDQGLVDSCTFGSLGRELQREVGYFSGPYINQSHRVPTIVYNGVYSEGLSGSSQVDFFNTFVSVSELQQEK